MAHCEHMLRSWAKRFSYLLWVKGEYVIKEYFPSYFLQMSDVTFDLGNNQK